MAGEIAGVSEKFVNWLNGFQDDKNTTSYISENKNNKPLPLVDNPNTFSPPAGNNVIAASTFSNGV